MESSPEVLVAMIIEIENRMSSAYSSPLMQPSAEILSGSCHVLLVQVFFVVDCGSLLAGAVTLPDGQTYYHGDATNRYPLPPRSQGRLIFVLVSPNWHTGDDESLLGAMQTRIEEGSKANAN
jgi:hypothetical protein